MFRKRLGFAMECAGPLYFAALAVGLGKLVLLQSFSILAVLGVLSPPSIGSILFVMLCGVVPGLVAELRLAPPLNITLPCVFLAVTALPVYLGREDDQSIVQLERIYSFAVLWAAPGMLLATLGMQIIVLSVLVWRSRATHPT